MNSCQLIYNLSSRPIYGSESGICRITGLQDVGIPFQKWVKKTFTDLDKIYPGTIISNAAAFCFDESSQELAQKLGRDKPQRFRTYSHIVVNGNWLPLTKADKAQILKILTEQKPQVVVLTDTGQRHLLFKNRPGFWQLDDFQISPEPDKLNFLHSKMMELHKLQFSQGEISSGHYKQYRIFNAGVGAWKKIEEQIKPYRGSKIFDLAAWLMYSIK